jgi:hypothetical protein
MQMSANSLVLEPRWQASQTFEESTEALALMIINNASKLGNKAQPSTWQQLTTAPHDVQQCAPPGLLARRAAGRFFDLGLQEASTTAAAFIKLLLGLLLMRGGRCTPASPAAFAAGGLPSGITDGVMPAVGLMQDVAIAAAAAAAATASAAACSNATCAELVPPTATVTTGNAAAAAAAAASASAHALAAAAAAAASAADSSASAHAFMLKSVELSGVQGLEVSHCCCCWC